MRLIDNRTMDDQKHVNQPATTVVPVQPMQAAANGTPQIVINIPKDGAKDGPADILNGVAAVLWPLLIALIMFLFRDQIISLVRRIRKGKAFGAEAEFDNELEALKREANRAKAETGAISDKHTDEKPNSAIITEPRGESEVFLINDIRANVLAEAARSRRLGLMLLSAKIDKIGWADCRINWTSRAEYASGTARFVGRSIATAYIRRISSVHPCKEPYRSRSGCLRGRDFERD